VDGAAAGAAAGGVTAVVPMTVPLERNKGSGGANCSLGRPDKGLAQLVIVEREQLTPSLRLLRCLYARSA
jgi:hypothetical protein